MDAPSLRISPDGQGPAPPAKGSFTKVARILQAARRLGRAVRPGDAVGIDPSNREW